MEKRTIFNSIEVNAAGVIFVKLRKQIVENGVEIAGEYHRFPIEPDVALEDVIAHVNVSLKGVAAAPVSEEAIDRIRRVRAAEHTPEVLAAWGEYRKAQRALSDANAVFAKVAKEGPESPTARTAAEDVLKAEDAVKGAYRATESLRRMRPA